MKNKRLYVVIPCYNEEEVLKETSKRLNVKLGELIKDKIISKDSKVTRSWKLLSVIGLIIFSFSFSEKAIL